MEYGGFIKRLEAGTVPPTLTYEDVVAKAISRADLAGDVRGINASLDIIRQTPGGRPPTSRATTRSCTARSATGSPTCSRSGNPISPTEKCRPTDLWPAGTPTWW